MKGKKAGIFSVFVTMFAFVGALGTVTPTCIGWFYETRVPEILRKVKI